MRESSECQLRGLIVCVGCCTDSITSGRTADGRTSPIADVQHARIDLNGIIYTTLLSAQRRVTQTAQLYGSQPHAHSSTRSTPHMFAASLSCSPPSVAQSPVLYRTDCTRTQAQPALIAAIILRLRLRRSDLLLVRFQYNPPLPLSPVRVVELAIYAYTTVCLATFDPSVRECV